MWKYNNNHNNVIQIENDRNFIKFRKKLCIPIIKTKKGNISNN